MGKHILITGADGAIGRAAAKALRAKRHVVRGFDLRQSALADEAVVGSITDAPLLAQAAAGIDCIIHLAATTDDADFMTQLLPNNIVGVYNILEAARLAGVPRIALASSLQVVSRPRAADETVLRVDSAPSPRNHYAATKLFAEDMGLLYANKYHMEVLCARIGWLPRNPEEARNIARRNAQNVFLSHDDAGRFFTCFVETPAISGPQPGYAIVFCFSRRTTENGFDLEPARNAIGYQPQDLFPAGLPFSI